MKRTLGFTAFLAIGSSVAHATPPLKPVLAVFEVSDQTKRLKPSERSQLSTYLSAKMAAGGAFAVVPREELKQALDAKKSDSYKACYDTSCQIEIGRELAASKVLQTSIVAIGKRCVVTGTIFDLRTSGSERAATETGGCDVDALFSSMERVVETLGRTTEAPAPAPVVAVAPVAEQKPEPRPGEPKEGEVLFDLFSAGPPLAPKTKGQFNQMECTTTANLVECRAQQPSDGRGLFDLSPSLSSAVDQYEIEASLRPEASLPGNYALTFGKRAAPGSFGYKLMSVGIDVSKPTPSLFMNYCDGNGWTTLLEQRPMTGIITPGAPLKIRVRVNGRRLRVFVNEQKITVLDSPISLDGSIQVAIGGTGTIKIDRLVVRDAV